MNNRQNGRRRGRGGQQVRNGQPGNQDRGNRIDNRARGNAAQLLEKYKNLAGEAQRQGDRVNTEYYLQFADHYFRVLSESRARFEEQRQQNDQQRGGRRDDYRDDYGQDGDFEAEGQRYDAGEANWGDDGDGRPPQRQQPEPRQYEQRRPQPRYEEAPTPSAEGEEQPAAASEGERRPRRARRSNPNGFANGEAAEAAPAERIEIDRLPQALSPAAAPANDAGGEAGEAPRPRRRAPRRPRGEEATIEA